MIMPAIAFHIALASAHVAIPENDLFKGSASVTRVGQPFCADPNDLHKFFVAAISGDEAMKAAVGSCSLFRYRRKAVVLRTLRGRNLLQVKVTVGHGFVSGYTTRVGLEAGSTASD